MDDQQTIYEAARDGHLQILQMCIEQYPRDAFPTLMSQRTQGMTPLLIACRNGHADVVEYLLDECGADIEQMGWADEDGLNVDGAEALWWATHHGHLSVVRSLVIRGAKVNGSTSMPRYLPLVEACIQGDIQIVKYLVANGVNVGAFQTDGYTALGRACHHGHLQIVSYLIRHGVDVPRDGSAALHICVTNLNLRCMKYLLRYEAEVDVILLFNTPLMFVRRTENPPELEYSLALPFIRRDPSAVLESLGFTCVDINQSEPFTLHTEMMRTVVKDKVNGHRVTAVQSNLGVEERMNILRIRKPIVGPIDPFVTASFYRGVSTGYRVHYTHEPTDVSAWEMVTALLRLSTMSVNHLTWSSVSLLKVMFTEMIQKNRPVVYELVVAVFFVAVREIGVRVMGGIPDTEPSFNETGYELLVTLKLLFCLAHLLPSMLEEHKRLFHDILRDLNRVNPRDDFGSTPLHMICCRGPDRFAPLPPESILVVFRLLLIFGADADAVDVYGNSPLHRVAMSTPVKHDVIDLLLRRGAAFNARNAQGQRFIELLPEEDRPRYRWSNYVSLKCLAATAIVHHHIPHDILPKALIHFVNLHR